MTMDEETSTALRGAIAKWKAIAEGTGKDKGTENCPLCAKFLHQPDMCSGCPVMKRTGSIGCWGTPYETWDKLTEEFDLDDDTEFGLNDAPLEYRARLARIARDELEFLQSLLPEEEQP
jgi:hypothetical protein